MVGGHMVGSGSTLRICARLVCAVLVAISPTMAGAQILQNLVPIAGSNESTAQAVNSTGLIVGYSSLGSADSPTVWSQSGGVYAAQALPTLSDLPRGAANAVNSNGMIAGYGTPADQSSATAIVWTGSPGAYSAAALPSGGGI